MDLKNKSPEEAVRIFNKNLIDVCHKIIPKKKNVIMQLHGGMKI